MPLSLTHTILLLSLYFSQGVPAGFIVHVLPPLMRQEGASFEAIGLLKLLALPWVLKVLWSPWVDQRNPPWQRGTVDRRRSWILGTQGLVIVLMGILAIFTGVPTELSGVLLACSLLFLLNTAAATQDIATDGLAVTLLSPHQRAWGNAIQVGGYKLGMIVCSSALLLAIPMWGWRFSLLGVVGLLLVCLLPILYRKPSLPLVSPLASPLASEGSAKTDDGRVGIRSHWAFLKQPGLGAWLGVLMVFKIPDALGSAMVKPMLVDRGMGLDEIAFLTLVLSSVGLAAVFLAGMVLDRWGMSRSLMLLALLQAGAMLAYAPLALGHGGVSMIWSVCLFEQVVDAFSTVALFAIMMEVCRPGHEGADFTVQACLQGLVAGIAGSLSGFIAGLTSLGLLFIAAGGFGLLVCMIVYRMPHTRSLGGAAS